MHILGRYKGSTKMICQKAEKVICKKQRYLLRAEISAKGRESDLPMANES